MVDSHSTDRTKQICQSFDVAFFEHKFEGHIQQKNYALEKTKFDVVLALDADEVLSKELRNSILQVKQNWKAQAYRFNRLNNFCGQWIKHGLWYPDRKIRLWDRREGKWGGKNPHDKVIMNEGAHVLHLPGDLLHYTVSTVEDFYDQQKKFSLIQARDLQKAGMSPNFLHLYLKPAYKFILSYILRLGFLDGKAGYIIAKGLAWQVRERYKNVLTASQ